MIIIGHTISGLFCALSMLAKTNKDIESAVYLILVAIFMQLTNLVLNK